MSAAGCDCRPGSRCRPCRERGRAHFRFYSVGARLHPEIREVTKLRNPVEWANQQTSYHDCRVALCLAMGVPLERIDPCTGHNLTNNVPAAASHGGMQRPGGKWWATDTDGDSDPPARVAVGATSGPRGGPEPARAETSIPSNI